MYAALEQLGFEEGKILEPSCGTGNFLGTLPDGMANSQLYGVELDGISARIAQALYPRADIRNSGFEDTDWKDGSFDVAIGNVPFGNYGVNDRKYNRHGFKIHDYFFAKALDQIRPGGIVAFITSTGTMDKTSSATRKYLAERAELAGAIRLPNGAFGAAGTSVATDVIFFQKRERPAVTEDSWQYLDWAPRGVKANSYFVEHPEMVLGEMKMVSGPFGETLAVVADESRPLIDQLREAVARLPHRIYKQRAEDTPELAPVLDADPTMRNFSYKVLDDGALYYRENQTMERVDQTGIRAERIRGMVKLGELTRDMLSAQAQDVPDEQVQ
jgi:hypothetical protein